MTKVYEQTILEKLRNLPPNDWPKSKISSIFWRTVRWRRVV